MFHEEIICNENESKYKCLLMNVKDSIKLMVNYKGLHN
jgi:hypothetical protein